VGDAGCQYVSGVSEVVESVIT